MQTGMELAGEAAEAGAKEVTLVHSGARLGASAAQHSVLQSRLERAGVRVVLGQRAQVSASNDKCIGWEGERARAFDHVFWATGSQVKVAFAEGLGAGVVQGGYVQVNTHLQVSPLPELHFAALVPVVHYFTSCWLSTLLPARAHVRDTAQRAHGQRQSCLAPSCCMLVR